MLRVTVPNSEYYDEEKEEFVQIKEQTLTMEHSLISLSKWEAKWKKPFLHSDKTYGETIDYYRCMTITPNVNPLTYLSLTREDKKRIGDYIEDPMTATKIYSNSQKSGTHRIITSELIYYYMFAYGIPMECEKWHLNRLITLIRVCSIENSPKKSMSRQAILSQNRSLNAARKAALHTKG